jgi:serine/threonine protein kinase/Flp pilus assembly protein TadD
MNRVQADGVAGSPSTVLAELIDRLTARVQAAEDVDWEQEAREHPEHAEALRSLGPALAALDDLSRSGEASSSDGTVPSTGENTFLGAVLGDFRILHEVGRGGMGVVYEAEQVSPGRRVALKVLPFAATVDPRQLQRFHNEARAAACLHHTNIVPVFGVGRERGIHFYAMQLIEGQTLAAVIAELRRGQGDKEPEGEPATTAYTPIPAASVAARTTPRAGLTTDGSVKSAAFFRSMARLGMQAAEALDYAHQMGVVHRDIRPGNLMLDGRGDVWVTDFGLAHLQQGEANLTLTGDLVGTLRYMSPEQALAKRVVIDHRTDVYSLGATLYELLTLRPAFDGGDRQELLRQVAFEEPQIPRKVSRAIPHELETVVLKAMEKNPQERYATAQELANDLRCWLEDKPIQARRPSWRQVMTKWARRHKPVVWATVVVLLLAALFGGSNWFWWAQKRARAEGEARAALQEATQCLEEEKWSEGLSAVRRAKGLLAAFGADLQLQQQLEELGKDLEMSRRLEEAHLQRAVGSKEARFDDAGADWLYAEAFEWYDLDVPTLSPHEAAKRLRASGISTRLIVGLDDWGHIKNRLQEGGGAALRKVADLADQDPWQRRLREAAARKDRPALEKLAEDEESQGKPPVNLLLLAAALDQVGNRVAAEEVLRRAQQAYPVDFWINFDLASTLLRKKPPDLAEATGFLRAARALRPGSDVVWNNLGYSLTYQKKLVEVEAAFHKAIALKPDDASAYSNLGALLCDHLDRPADAERLFRKAIALKPDYAEAHYNLGNALCQQKKLEEAMAEFRKAIRIKPDYGSAYSNLGAALGEQKKLGEEVTAFRKADQLLPNDLDIRNNLRLTERWLELDKQWPAILAGKAKPNSLGEQVELAFFCIAYKEYHRAAVDFYTDAFTADPNLAADLNAQHRYNAACAAALAAAGKGVDANKLDDKKRARLRQKALDWLRADLRAWNNVLERHSDTAGPKVVNLMQHWLNDSEFAGVRAPEAQKLPAAEQSAWQKLWADVENLLAQARKKPVPEEKSGTK